MKRKQTPTSQEFPRMIFHRFKCRYIWNVFDWHGFFDIITGTYSHYSIEFRIVFFAVIIISEFMEEFSLLGMTIAIWAMIIGIPLFLMISLLLIFGDKRYAPEKDEARKEATAQLKQKFENKTAVKRPIKVRR